MNFLQQPWQAFCPILVAWIKYQQQHVIDFQRSQIEALLEAQGNKRILLNDEQRRSLAIKGKALGRKTLSELTTIVTPNTILRWHRQLVVQNGYTETRSKEAKGRPRRDQAIVELVLRMARENVNWGYKRIQGALDKVGHAICSSTVANILKAHGIEPAPVRKRQLSWHVVVSPELKEVVSPIRVIE